jgi:hypothetical protein
MLLIYRQYSGGARANSNLEQGGPVAEAWGELGAACNYVSRRLGYRGKRRRATQGAQFTMRTAALLAISLKQLHRGSRTQSGEGA